MKNTLADVKGRGCRDRVHSSSVSVISGRKVKATFHRATPSPERRLLEPNAFGLLLGHHLCIDSGNDEITAMQMCRISTAWLPGWFVETNLCVLWG